MPMEVTITRPLCRSTRAWDITADWPGVIEAWDLVVLQIQGRASLGGNLKLQLATVFQPWLLLV